MAKLRTITLPGVWAANAATTIPSPPVSGQSYRQASPSKADWQIGQQFDTLADSARWNALLYSVTALLENLEQNGVLGYSQLSNYNVGAVCIGPDNGLYQAKKASGPSNGGAQATTNATYWGKVAANGGSTPSAAQAGSGITVSAAGVIAAKIAGSGGIKFNASGEMYIEPSAFSVDITNELLKQLRLPQWLAKTTNFYVNSSTGSDTNDGLTETTAFKTINKCLQFVSENYNLGIYNANIRIASGIYEEQVEMPKYSSSTGIFAIRGASRDTVRIQNFVHRLNGAGSVNIYEVTFNTKGLPVIGSSAHSTCLYIANGTTAALQGVNFVCDTAPQEAQVSTRPITCELGSTVTLYDDINFTFNAEAAVANVLNIANSGSAITRGAVSMNGPVSAATLNLHALSQFLVSNRKGAPAAAITGTVTGGGKRYSVAMNSIAVTGSQNFFPGTVAGTTATGGQYM